MALWGGGNWIRSVTKQTLDLAEGRQEDHNKSAQKFPTFAASSLKDIVVMEDAKPF